MKKIYEMSTIGITDKLEDLITKEIYEMFFQNLNYQIQFSKIEFDNYEKLFSKKHEEIYIISSLTDITTLDIEENILYSCSSKLKYDEFIYIYELLSSKDIKIIMAFSKERKESLLPLFDPYYKLGYEILISKNIYNEIIFNYDLKDFSKFKKHFEKYKIDSCEYFVNKVMNKNDFLEYNEIEEAEKILENMVVEKFSVPRTIDTIGLLEDLNFKEKMKDILKNKYVNEEGFKIVGVLHNEIIFEKRLYQNKFVRLKITIYISDNPYADMINSKVKEVNEMLDENQKIEFLSKDERFYIGFSLFNNHTGIKTEISKKNYDHWPLKFYRILRIGDLEFLIDTLNPYLDEIIDLIAQTYENGIIVNENKLKTIID